MRFKKILLPLIVFFTSSLMILTACEIFLRATDFKTILPNNCRGFDPRFDSILIPNTSCRFKTQEWDVVYNINSEGVRRSGFEKIKLKGVKRIIVVGDSFVEGYGLSENEMFTKKLEDQLNSNSQEKFEVIPAGVSGSSTVQERQSIINKWLDYNPDLIILEMNVTDFKENFDAENRFSENIFASPPLFKEQDKPVVNKYSLLFFIPTPVKYYLNQNFYTYRLLNTRLKSFFEKMKGKENKPFIEGDIKSDLFAITRQNLFDNYEEIWKIPQNSIAQIQKALSAKKVPLALLYIPHGHVVAKNQWLQGRKYYDLSRLDIYPNRIPEELKSRFPALPLIDLTPAFKSHADKLLYFPLDGHINPYGAEIASEAINDSLKSNPRLVEEILRH
jgi:lysophospholipase L1-like esterase